MNEKIEHISFEKIRHVKILVNDIVYRTFHAHNAFEILLCLSSNAVISVKGKKYRMKSEDIALISPHQVHDILSESRAGARFLIVQVSRNFLQEYLSGLKTTVFSDTLITDVLEKEKADELRKVLLSLAIEYFSLSNENEGIIVIYKLVGILAFFLGNLAYTRYTEQEYLEHTKIIGRVTRIAEYIDKNYQYKVTLEDIAAEENLSANYVSQFFTNYIGVTFQKYINNVRLEAAIRLLTDDSLTVSEVANYSGFADAKYMAHVFRRYFGCPPNEYRKRPVHVPSSVIEVTKKESSTEFILGRAASLSVLTAALSALNEKK